MNSNIEPILLLLKAHQDPTIGLEPFRNTESYIRILNQPLQIK